MYRNIAGLLSAVLMLGACTGGPTYGTGKSAMEQLADDIVGVASFGGDRARSDLKYGSRPGLVFPAHLRAEQLAAPQQSLANRQPNPQWAESPEEIRKRLREEADANADNPNYRSPFLSGNGTNGQMTESQKWQVFRKAKANVEGGSVVNTGQRKYLTDPPLAYRSLPQDQLIDLGEPEQKKERQRKKNAAIDNSGSDWWNPF